MSLLFSEGGRGSAREQPGFQSRVEALAKELGANGGLARDVGAGGPSKVQREEARKAVVNAEASVVEATSKVNEEKRERRERSKKRGSKRSRSTKRRRRSPSSSCGSSRSSSVFRLARNADRGSHRTRLIEFAKRHPGKLARKTLEQMRDAIYRDGDSHGRQCPDSITKRCTGLPGWGRLPRGTIRNFVPWHG